MNEAALAWFLLSVGYIVWDSMRARWMRLPDPTLITPFEMAALRDGWRGVVHLALYELIQSKAVRVEYDAGPEGDSEDEETRRSRRRDKNRPKPTFHAEGGARLSGQSEFAKMLYRRLHNAKVGMTLEQLVLDETPKKESLSHWAAVTRNLAKKGLTRGGKSTQHLVLAYLSAFISVLLLGDDADYWLLWFVLAIPLFISKPWKKGTSPLGKRFLKASQGDLEWLRRDFKRGERPEGVEPLFIAGVFGLSAVATDLPDVMQSVFTYPRMREEGSYAGGCGCGGCGSDPSTVATDTAATPGGCGSGGSDGGCGGGSDGGGCGGGGCGG
ncbi:MAG: TIGR04222 domain-containing membrane protein, partial [Magnetococcales bacterium]|nr:TIGR04222 domain-containing membrane protein [Magnetococcales bacterium]